ncbi:MAG: cupredoxin domain-containing protein [Chloroflexota bacterium]
MRTQFSETTNSPQINWPRIGLYAGLSLIGLLVVAATAVFFSPIGQRWQADQTSAPPAQGVNEIEILADDALNHLFSPAVTQVAVGTTVTWQFKDVDEAGQPVLHNVVFSDEASPVQATGSFSRTFNEPGTYEYICSLHAFMDGVVIVTE